MRHLFRASLIILCTTLLCRGAEILMSDRLDQAVLDAAWVAHCSPGNSIRPTRDGIEITAAENTYAHLQRGLGQDRVRAQCRIKPGSGISWCSSLFLYWAPGDWCQVGVITRGGGRYYVCVMENGRADEHDLAPCEFDQWQYLAIELGTNIIRFASSREGNVWTTQCWVARPERFNGAPALVVLGKGYGTGASTPDLNANYGERGTVAVSRIDNFVVTRTEPSRLGVTVEDRREREMAGRDPLGAKELSVQDDPSFESVSRHLPALKHPREVVGVKDHAFEVGVDFEGTLQLPTPNDNWQNDGPKAFFEVGGKRFGSGGCQKRLLEGSLPVVVARWKADGLECEQTVFGWSEGMRDDQPLWACARLQVSAASERAVEVALRLKPDQVGQKPPRRELKLAAGQAASVSVEISADGQNTSVAELTPDEFGRRLVAAAEAWRNVLGSGLKLTVPEARVNEAWRAWLAYNFLNVDRKGSLYEIHDGGGFYEAIYGYSAALFCHALDLYGHHADARRYLESLLRLQRPDGLFFINYGYPDTGALLFALAEHYRFSADEAWLRQVAPAMVKMCGWIIARRKTSMQQTPAHRPVTWGLVKFTPYADYQEQTFDYYGDTYGCVGLEQTAQVLGAIGLKAEAGRLAREASAYRADILASMDAAVIEREGLRILPMEPDTHRLLKSTRYQAGGYYGLVASMMLENGFLPAGDPRARWVTEFLENRRGLILGMCEFGGGVDHAYSYGYWLDCLRRGEVKRPLLGFYGSLAYGMGRDTYCGVEVTQLLSGQPTATMPHTYSGTQQLRLLRMLLLREEGENLLIGQAIPRPWLAAGQRIAMRDAPTHFGPVSWQIESLADQTLIRLEPPGRRQPRSVRLWLRHPDQRPLRRVELNGKPLRTFEHEMIRLQPLAGTMEIRAWR